MAKGSAGKGEPGGMASAGGGNAAFEVSMIPEDYKRLSPEVIAKIKPLTDDPETSDTGQLAFRTKWHNDFAIQPFFLLYAAFYTAFSKINFKFPFPV